MPNTTVAWGTFPSRKAANQAVQRLVSGGFARNSIDLHRHEDDEGYDLSVHTREGNLSRAERLIHASSTMHSFERAASGTFQTAKAHPFLLLGGGILAGLAIYSLFAAREEPPRQPRRQGKR
jgi:hypothetical protein